MSDKEMFYLAEENRALREAVARQEDIVDKWVHAAEEAEAEVAQLRARDDENAQLILTLGAKLKEVVEALGEVESWLAPMRADAPDGLSRLHDRARAALDAAKEKP